MMKSNFAYLTKDMANLQLVVNYTNVSCGHPSCMQHACVPPVVAVADVLDALSAVELEPDLSSAGNATFLVSTRRGPPGRAG